MEVIALGAIIGISALSSQYYFDQGPNAYDVKRKSDLHALAERHARDIRDAGDIYFMQGRPLQAGNAQVKFVSDWYLPMSNPTQEPTYELEEVIESRALNEALYESQAPKFLFESKDTLGISYGAGQKNNGYNFGAPYEGISFSGDPDNSLAHQAKVFIDNYSLPSTEYTNRYFMAAGEPTVTQRAELGDEADVPISNRNPYGPFGYYQAIMRNRLYNESDPNIGIRPRQIGAPPTKKRVRFRPQPTNLFY